MSSIFCINLRKFQNNLTFNVTSMCCLQSSLVLGHNIQAFTKSNRSCKIVLQLHFNSISQDCCVETISISKSIMTSFHILFLKFPSFYLKNMFYFLCIFLSSQAFLHQVSSQLSTSSFMIIQDKHCTSSFSLFLQSNVYNFFPKAKTQPLPPTHLHIQIWRSFNFINASVNRFPPSHSIFQCKT